MVYDISIWEQIRYPVEHETYALVEAIKTEISKDFSLREFYGGNSDPWQLREVMLQRAESWVQRAYVLSCDVYKRRGKELSVGFDRSVWAYHVEPFIMREVQVDITGCPRSRLLELLLCAVGSQPERRKQLTVTQKQVCMEVRARIYETWHDKLHHLPPRIQEAAAAMARFNEMEARAARIVRGLPPEPSSPIANTHSEANLPTSVGSVAPVSPAETPELKPAAVPMPSASEKNSVSIADKCSQSPSEARWENIEISFLSDERVQILVGTKRETVNYAEFGFADGRSGNPNQAWILLRALAEHRGIIRNEKEADQPWPKVEKRIQEIRAILRLYFGNSPTDPVPFVEGTGYQTRFKISCAPSYDT